MKRQSQRRQKRVSAAFYSDGRSSTLLPDAPMWQIRNAPGDSLTARARAAGVSQVEYYQLRHRETPALLAWMLGKNLDRNVVVVNEGQRERLRRATDYIAFLKRMGSNNSAYGKWWKTFPTDALFPFAAWLFGLLKEPDNYMILLPHEYEGQQTVRRAGIPFGTVQRWHENADAWAALQASVAFAREQTQRDKIRGRRPPAGPPAHSEAWQTFFRGRAGRERWNRDRTQRLMLAYAECAARLDLPTPRCDQARRLGCYYDVIDFVDRSNEVSFSKVGIIRPGLYVASESQLAFQKVAKAAQVREKIHELRRKLPCFDQLFLELTQPRPKQTHEIAREPRSDEDQRDALILQTLRDAVARGERPRAADLLQRCRAANAELFASMAPRDLGRRLAAHGVTAQREKRARAAYTQLPERARKLVNTMADATEKRRMGILLDELAAAIKQGQQLDASGLLARCRAADAELFANPTHRHIGRWLRAYGIEPSHPPQRSVYTTIPAAPNGRNQVPLRGLTEHETSAEPKRRDEGWQFVPGKVRYDERECSISGKPALLLKAIATAPDHQLTLDQVIAAAWEPADDATFKNVHPILTIVRDTVRTLFGLPDSFNPLPAVSRGKDLAWKLRLKVGDEAARKPTVAQRLRDLHNTQPETKVWSLRKLADTLGCSPKAIQNART